MYRNELSLVALQSFFLGFIIANKYNENSGSMPYLNLMDLELSEGKKQYEIIKNQAPTYGECWKKAVSDLHEGCKHLTDDTQSRLALSFTNCFLSKLELPTYPCSRENEIAICLRNIDDKAFNTYAEFFTHTQSICFFLQSQAWQEQTENTIDRLSTSSLKLSRQLEASGRAQDEVLQLQHLSLRKQERLMKSGENLNLELERSRNNVRNIFDEFKSSISVQRTMLYDVFDRITKLQSFVLGEFTGFYTLIFYFVSAFMCYLLTSTSRTSEARFWMFLILTVNFAIERTVSSYSIDEKRGEDILVHATGLVYQRMWFCRKIACTLAAVVLLWFAYKYKDYNVLNNKLLLEIHKQNENLKCYLHNIGISPENTLLHASKHKSTPSNKGTARAVDSCYDSGDSDSSYDRTFHYSTDDESIGSEDNNSSTKASQHKLCKTSYNQQLERKAEFPMLTPRKEDLVSTLNKPNNVRKLQKNKGGNESSSSTPRYNLRARAPSIQKDSPKVLSETPRAFSQVIHTMAKKSYLKSSKIEQTLQKTQHRSFFSSEED